MAADAATTVKVPSTTNPRPRTVPEEVGGENMRERETPNAGRPPVTTDSPGYHFARPGITPDDHDVLADADSSEPDRSPDPERREPSELIVEIAPEVFPSETEPQREDPSEVITEIAPEVGPSETEPKRDDPSEVVTEIAPEIGPSETEPGRYEPSEVVIEIAPEVGPSETGPGPYKPSEVVTEIAPEIRPSEVAPEIRPDEPDEER